VTDVKRGPVITRYEVQPGAGVRVASIANLDKDLARSLSALAVRIEAPVPGKNVVGIEIPNKKVHLVRMRDVLEQPDFLSHPSKLAFVLGKDIAGQPKWGDLTKDAAFADRGKHELRQIGVLELGDCVDSGARAARRSALFSHRPETRRTHALQRHSPFDARCRRRAETSGDCASPRD
jgi:hypothetical protein